MTWNTDLVAQCALCFSCFVGGVMFAAHRQLQRERLARWLRRQRRV